MFSNDIRQWLLANQHPTYANRLAAKRDSIENALVSLGIANNSELAYLYLNYGPYPVRGWYELNEVEKIKKITNYAHSQLGVPGNFLALTGIEGQGITLLDIITGAVFDVEFGQFERLISGELAPIAKSFGEFLEWCKSHENV